jgi:hypothetical protein
MSWPLRLIQIYALPLPVLLQLFKRAVISTEATDNLTVCCTARTPVLLIATGNLPQPAHVDGATNNGPGQSCRSAGKLHLMFLRFFEERFEERNAACHLPGVSCRNHAVFII